MQIQIIRRLGLIVGGAALACAAVFALTPHAHAADLNLGGNCCADLEDRIADLEATAARKGNRKVSLTITGDINKAIIVDDGSVSYSDFGKSSRGPWSHSWGSESFHDKGVQDNSATPSVVDIKGSALITPDLYASYTLEIGVGGYDENSLNSDTNGLYVRKSFWTLGSKRIGSVSVGELSSATENLFSETNVANTSVAVKPLSLSPITGPSVGRASNPYDPFVGQIVNGVRYDSPTWEGFSASASWANDAHPYFGSNDTKEAWDVAMHYVGEPIKGIALAASAGYSDATVVNTVLFAASLKHIPTGLFVTGDYGKVLNFDVGAHEDRSQDGWAVQAGIEQKFIPLGKTTIFGEYGTLSANDTFSGTRYSEAYPIDANYVGGGVVQSFDAAAMDVYLSVRQYSATADETRTWSTGFNTERLDLDATVGVLGARLKF